MLSAASARGPAGLLVRATALVAVASALVVPARGANVGPERPAAPSRLEVARTTETTIGWSWPDKRAEPGTLYRVFKNRALVGSTTETSYTFRGLRCGTAYRLGVEAVSASGAFSARVTVFAATAPCVLPTTDGPPVKVEPSSAKHPATTTAPPVVAPVVPEVLTVPDLSDHPEPHGLWSQAGAFVWHETAVDPEALGVQLRDNGFGWVAVLLHDGLTVDPVEDDWLRRFRETSGLAVGGWGVLRTHPEQEAELADGLLQRYSLDFYIANAEAEYKFSGDDGTSEMRFARSREFVETFRRARPDLPAAVSSYCAPARQDLDWPTWSAAGFDFLPQAYVNDFGDAATPAACTEAAAKYFAPEQVHPTIGVYRGQADEISADRYVSLLDEAGTLGFSVYLAETRMHGPDWRTLGNVIESLGLALLPGEEVEPPAPEPRPASHTD